MDGLTLQLIIGLVGGVICASVASAKGRNAVGWFFLGFFFALISVIIVLCVSNLKEERARYAHHAAEQRRLREELRLERMRNQQFRGQAMQRLDVHDRALGVDTKQLAPPLASGTVEVREIAGPAEGVTVDAPEATADAPGTAPPVPAPSAATWFYATRDARRIGPIEYEALAGAFKSGELDEESLVWRAGWKDWHRVGDVPDLLSRLRS